MRFSTKRASDLHRRAAIHREQMDRMFRLKNEFHDQTLRTCTFCPCIRREVEFRKVGTSEFLMCPEGRCNQPTDYNVRIMEYIRESLCFAAPQSADKPATAPKTPTKTKRAKSNPRANKRRGSDSGVAAKS